MKIIFLDRFGCYASVAAASYLVGKIKEKPTAMEIGHLLKLYASTDLGTGKMHYIGKDQRGAGLYSLGVGSQSKLVTVAVFDLLKIQGVEEEVKLIDISSFNPLIMRIPWYLGLYRPLKRTGNLFSALFLRRYMPRIIDYVRSELNE